MKDRDKIPPVAGKIVWITGAGSGLGRALAVRAAARGATVAASARTVAALESLARETGGRVVPFPLDVADRDATARTVAAIESELGPVATAVLNAGTHIPMGLRDFNADAAGRLIAVNYMGVVHGLEALLPRMLARGAAGKETAGKEGNKPVGRIAVVASVAGYRGLPTAAAYGPTKAALINLCESLHTECRRAGIVLQVVNPGFVDTPLTARNPFPMPDLMTADAAAECMWRGLESDRFEIAFPPRFVAALKLARLLPHRLYFALTRKITGL